MSSFPLLLLVYASEKLSCQTRWWIEPPVAHLRQLDHREAFDETGVRRKDYPAPLRQWAERGASFLSGCQLAAPFRMRGALQRCVFFPCTALPSIAVPLTHRLLFHSTPHRSAPWTLLFHRSSKIMRNLCVKCKLTTTVSDVRIKKRVASEIYVEIRTLLGG